MSAAGDSPSTSSLSVNDFSASIQNKNVFFKVITMKDSFLVWIGLEPKLSNLSVAMPSKLSQIPDSSLLFGKKAEADSSILAQKLAKRFSKQVFVSCSIPFDPEFSLLVEKQLSQELVPLIAPAHPVK